MICLDVNIVRGIINRQRANLVARLDAELERRTHSILPAIVLFELRNGIAKSQWPENNSIILEEFLDATIEIVPFEKPGIVRAQLERIGLPIGPCDILIAAQAWRRGAILVTASRREFERVPGLMVQDWTNRWSPAPAVSDRCRESPPRLPLPHGQNHRAAAPVPAG